MVNRRPTMQWRPLRHLHISDGFTNLIWTFVCFNIIIKLTAINVMLSVQWVIEILPKNPVRLKENPKNTEKN